MLLPRLFATGLWLVATVGSTVMVWAATSVVAADVTDRPAAVVPHRDVVDELESGPPPPTRPTTTTQRAGAPTSTVATSGGGSIPVSPQAPPAATPRSPAPQQPGVTLPPSAPPTTAPPASLPSSRPSSPPTTQRPPRPTATYSTAGGAVRVRCDGFSIDLISAIPSNGYSVKVIAAGPRNVDVRFIRSGRELSVKAACFGQPFRYYEQSPPRQPPSSP